MDDSTPLPKTMEYGQLTVETLDEVAPRLIKFTQDLIEHLKSCKIKIATTTVYLLNSTDHPIEVPCSGNGIPIEMNFVASLPVWAPDPRAKLQVSFNHGRRYFYSELGKESRNAKFPMSKVLKRFLSEIKVEERKLRIQEEKAQKTAKAHQALTDISNAHNIPPTEDPNIIQKNNLKIMCLPKTPTLATIVLTVPYEQLPEIISKYMKD